MSFWDRHGNVVAGVIVLRSLRSLSGATSERCCLDRPLALWFSARMMRATVIQGAHRTRGRE